MKNIFKIAILFLSLTLVQCSSDDATASDNLLVDGVAFKLGAVRVESADNSKMFSLVEKTDDAAGQRIIQVFAMHTNNLPSGTYELRSNLTASGVANIAIYNTSFIPIAGGSENQPTGTLTILHYQGNKYKLTFNDVVLDPGTATETTISGSTTRTFPEGSLAN